MDNSESDNSKVSLEDEPDNIVVVDPDEYQKTKQLQSINEAKEAVREMRREKPLRTSSKKWDAFHARAAERVSDYGREMWTLIKKAKERDVLKESDLEAGGVDIQELILTDGRVQEDDGYRKAKEPEYMAVYTQLTVIEDKLGLGLELKEDKGPAEI
jgi:hypothetical protein